MAKWANSDEEDDDDNDEGAADERASQSGAPFVYLYGPVSRHVTPEIYEVNIVVPVSPLLEQDGPRTNRAVLQYSNRTNN